MVYLQLLISLIEEKKWDKKNLSTIEVREIFYFIIYLPWSFTFL